MSDQPTPTTGEAQPLMAVPSTELLVLLRAAFSAGFRLGHKYGGDAATAWEWGERSREPQTADAAWDNDVKWRLETDTSMRMNPNEIKAWESVD